MVAWRHSGGPWPNWARVAILQIGTFSALLSARGQCLATWWPILRITEGGPDGNPWFVAKPVCDVLEIVNVTRALDGLDEDEKSTCPSYYESQVRHLNIISESGLYSLILRSRDGALALGYQQ